MKRIIALAALALSTAQSANAELKDRMYFWGTVVSETPERELVPVYFALYSEEDGQLFSGDLMRFGHYRDFSKLDGVIPNISWSLEIVSVDINCRNRTLTPATITFLNDSFDQVNIKPDTPGLVYDSTPLNVSRFEGSYFEGMYRYACEGTAPSDTYFSSAEQEELIAHARSEKLRR